MAQHKAFTVATNVNVYFCDPHSPWQRGTNENTNRLLRQYFPRGTDLSRYSQSDLDKIALRLNRRPRETLGFQTPTDKLQGECCADPLGPPLFLWGSVTAPRSSSPSLSARARN
jgi:IS30 family transposase